MTAPTDKFGFLFEDAQRRREYQRSAAKVEIDSECTFKPNIVRSQVRSRSPMLVSTVRKLNFDYMSTKKRQRKAVTPVKEQPTFAPKVGRPPKKSRDKAVWDHLHEMAKLNTEKARRTREEAIQRSAKQHDILRPNPETEKFARRRRFESYAQAFRLLDSDQDGLISAACVAVSSQLYTPNKWRSRFARATAGTLHAAALRDGRAGSDLDSRGIL